MQACVCNRLCVHTRAGCIYIQDPPVKTPEVTRASRLLVGGWRGGRDSAHVVFKIPKKNSEMRRSVLWTGVPIQTADSLSPIATGKHRVCAQSVVWICCLFVCMCVFGRIYTHVLAHSLRVCVCARLSTNPAWPLHCLPLSAMDSEEG